MLMTYTCYTLSQALTDREVSEDELWTDPLVLFEAPIELLTTHVGKPIVLLTTHVGKPRKYKAKFDNLLLAKNLIQNKYETQP